MKAFCACVADMMMVVFGAFVSARLYFGETVSEPLLHAVFGALVVAMSVAVFPMFGIYRSWRGRVLGILFLRLILAWTVVQGIGAALVVALHGVHSLSLAWILWWTGLTGAGLLAARAVAYAALASIRIAGADLRAVVVVGANPYLARVAHGIDHRNAPGFTVVDTVELTAIGRDARQSCVDDDLRRLERLHALAQAGDVQEIWLALPLAADDALQRCVDALRGTAVDLRFLPDVTSLGLDSAGGVLNLMGRPALTLSPSSLARDAINGKEVFDRLFAAVALLALLPLMGAIALAVRLSSPGPVLFRQKRKGLNGRAFTIYKFRTMRVHDTRKGVVRQATRDDPRVTRVGRFLRRTSLDELPQFINVLRGEMSVVGPRPHALEHDELYRSLISGYMDRYRIKPGITGWAQVNGCRGETAHVEMMEGRVAYDLYYIHNWSFTLDLRIVAMTLVKGFGGSRAY